MTKTKDIDDNNNYSYYEHILIDNIGLDDTHILTLLRRNNNSSSSVYFYNKNGHNLLLFALICGYNPIGKICAYLKTLLEHNNPDITGMTPKICEEEMLKFNITPLHFAIAYKYNKVAFQLIKGSDTNLILQRDKNSEEYGGGKNALELSITLQRDQLLQYMIERLLYFQYSVEEIRRKIKINNKEEEDGKYFEEILQKVTNKPNKEFQNPHSVQQPLPIKKER